MSKTKNNELKFSIRNLIDTTSCEKTEKGQSTGIRHPQTSHSLKRLVAEPQTPLIRRPIPIINNKIPHPCWSFLTQLTNKNPNVTFPLNSSLIFLSKMTQAWEQIQRTQNSSSITTENDDVSDEDIDLDTSSIRHDIEIEDDDEEEEEEDDDDDDDDEVECSSSGGDKLNRSSNSEENDKLKSYPCTHCGKVRLTFIFLSNIKIQLFLQIDFYCSVQFSSTYASTYWYSSICLQSMWKRFSTSINTLSS
jgi:hypothetical protein